MSLSSSAILFTKLIICIFSYAVVVVPDSQSFETLVQWYSRRESVYIYLKALAALKLSC